MFRFQNLVVDEARLELRSGDDLIDVEPQVFALLVYLIENRERVVSKDELIEAVWQGRIVSDATLNSRINALRRAVGDSGKTQSTIRTYPRRGFRFVATLETPVGRESRDNRETSENTLPSIAVSQFRYLAETDELVFLAEGVTEDIITALSRVRWLSVILPATTPSDGVENLSGASASENINADYIVSGSVRASSSTIRVSAQITDTKTRQPVWAKSFDGRIDALFDLQDEIAFAVASHLEPEITRIESERLRRQNRRKELNAWQHYLRAIPHIAVLEREENEMARAELARAIDADSAFVLPHVALAWCWAFAALHGWCRSGAEALSLSSKHARKALELDPGDARAYCAMAIAEFWIGNQRNAIEYARQSLDIDPNMTDAHGILGSAQAISGEPDKGIDSLNRALRGSPRDPIRWFWYHGLANANFAKENYLEACTWAAKATQVRATIPQCHLVKAASLALSGDLEAAGNEIKVISQHAPHYTIRRIKRNPMWTDVTSFDRLVTGARTAGLPR